MLDEYLHRKKVSKASNKLKSLQTNLSKMENNQELFSDLLSVEARDIYTTASLQLESVNLLLEYRSMINSTKLGRRETSLGGDSNSLILDIGGNIGFYARYFSKRFNNCIALEPNPRTFQLLELNTRSIDNILALNLGCSSSSTTKILRGSLLHSGGYKISSSAEISDLCVDSMVSEYKVQVVTYRDLKQHIKENHKFYYENLPDPSVIKIDVEGHELEVLKGLHLELFERLPAILLELNGSRQSREDVINFLRNMNYLRFVTTTNLLAQGEKSRFNNLRNLYQIGGLRLIMKSLNTNTVVILNNPELYRLEQLLVLEI